MPGEIDNQQLQRELTAYVEQLNEWVERNTGHELASDLEQLVTYLQENIPVAFTLLEEENREVSALLEQHQQLDREGREKIAQLRQFLAQEQPKPMAPPREPFDEGRWRHVQRRLVGRLKPASMRESMRESMPSREMPEWALAESLERSIAAVDVSAIKEKSPGEEIGQLQESCSLGWTNWLAASRGGAESVVDPSADPSASNGWSDLFGKLSGDGSKK